MPKCIKLSCEQEALTGDYWCKEHWDLLHADKSVIKTFTETRFEEIEKKLSDLEGLLKHVVTNLATKQGNINEA